MYSLLTLVFLTLSSVAISQGTAGKNSSSIRPSPPQTYTQSTPPTASAVSGLPGGSSSSTPARSIVPTVYSTPTRSVAPIPTYTESMTRTVTPDVSTTNTMTAMATMTATTTITPTATITANTTSMAAANSMTTMPITVQNESSIGPIVAAAPTSEAQDVVVTSAILGTVVGTMIVGSGIMFILENMRKRRQKISTTKIIMTGFTDIPSCITVNPVDTITVQTNYSSHLLRGDLPQSQSLAPMMARAGRAQ